VGLVMAESYEDKRYKEVMQKSVKERAATPIRKETPKKVEQAILDARGAKREKAPKGKPKGEDKTKNVKEAVRAERKPKGKEGKPFVEFNSGKVTEENLKKGNQKVFDKKQRKERDKQYKDTKAEANALREKRYQDDKKARDKEAGQWKPSDSKNVLKQLVGMGFSLALAFLIAKFVLRNGKFQVKENKLINTQTGEVIQTYDSAITRELNAKHVQMGKAMDESLRKSPPPVIVDNKVEDELRRNMAGAGAALDPKQKVQQATRMVVYGDRDIWATFLTDRTLYMALPTSTNDVGQAYSRTIFRGKDANRQLGSYLNELQYVRPYKGKKN
jgi:hypothetical protein